MNKEKKFILPKDFFTKQRPPKKKPDKPEDMIPFNWPKEVLTGKAQVIISNNN